MNKMSLESRLDQLFQSRCHGVVNTSGIRFQLAYSILRAFDLYERDSPAAILLEAIDDTDVNGCRRVELTKLMISNRYIQVRTSKRAWDWGKFGSSKILAGFLEVWPADPSAELLVVTDFRYGGALDELAKFCGGERYVLSNKVKRELKTLCERAGHAGVDPVKLARRITFVPTSEEDLRDRVIRAIVKHFKLTSPNPEFQYSVLMGRVLDLALQRREIRFEDLDSMRLSIKESMDFGAGNPAIENRWLEMLEFREEAHPEDFYEGKNARPGHILADMDVRRPVWETRIEETLRWSRACIVRAAAGQGKSTLLYRYAHERYHPETTFVIRRLNEESMAGPIREAIAARLTLGLPILVLIDDIGADLRLWRLAAAEPADGEVRFLVAVREEDLRRCSSSISGFPGEMVTLELSTVEAWSIHGEFHGQGKVAPTVRSAAWAFEQIADNPLLIEFIHLITHGRGLEEMLGEQVEEMRQAGEAAAKLHALRLLSVAQVHGARITEQALLDCLRQFTDEPGLILKSLEGDYLVSADGACEGPHPVRSRHLASLLHHELPMEDTIVSLIRTLGREDLEYFVVSVFSDTGPDHAPLLSALTERCAHEPIGTINRVARALFAAGETAYFLPHKHLFDAAFEQVGSGAVLWLCSSTLPFPGDTPGEDLKAIVGADLSKIETLTDCARRFSPRSWEDRFEVKFLRGIAESPDFHPSTEDFQQLWVLLGWFKLPGASPRKLVGLLAEHDWREHIYNAPLSAAANFLSALHDHAPESYERLMDTDRTALTSFFKMAGDTLLVEERGEDIYIEFVVDQREGADNPGDQAVERLRILRGFFPGYRHYRSQGLYASTYGSPFPLSVDDSRKQLARGAFELEADLGKNRPYLGEVQSRYAAQSVYEWQEQWFLLRGELLYAFGECIGVYEGLFRGKQADYSRVQNAFDGASRRIRTLRKLPLPLEEKLGWTARPAEEWMAGADNFLAQFPGQDPADPNQRFSLLMRHNLRDAIHKMPRAHAAFRKIIDETHACFDLPGLNGNEIKEYSALADILDFWFERPSMEVPDLRKAAKKMRLDKKKQFTDALRSAMKPLEEQGFRFTYPNGPLEDHPLVCVCLGFEIASFQAVSIQVLTIIAQLASLPEIFHLAYLVPLLKGSRYSPTVMRVAAENIRRIAKGDPFEGMEWVILPVDPPEGFGEVLPDMGYITLEEFALISEFHEICGALNVIRNTAYFVMSRLDPNQASELKLAEEYLHRRQREYDELNSKMGDWSQKILRITYGNPVAGEWSEVCQACVQRIQKLDDLNALEPQSFQPANLLTDVELQNRLNRYLDAKYLSHA